MRRSSPCDKFARLIAKQRKTAMRQLHDLKRLEVSAFLVDARGKACPAPIIELAKALKTSSIVELWADDPAARGDLEAFCSAVGHRLSTCAEDDLTFRAVVHRGAAL
jgi:TusA-related sulfurtransferase